MNVPDGKHTEGLLVVRVTGRPELAVGFTTTGDWSIVLAPIVAKVMVWLGRVTGVTALDGSDAGPVPISLVARTVNV